MKKWKTKKGLLFLLTKKNITMAIRTKEREQEIEMTIGAIDEDD